MPALALSRIGQIALATADVDRAEAFYRDVLGLRHLYRYGDLTFFDCAGVRLLIEKTHDPEHVNPGSPIYFTCHDITLTVAVTRFACVPSVVPPGPCAVNCALFPLNEMLVILFAVKETPADESE